MKPAQPLAVLFDDDSEDRRLCQPIEGDVRGDPARCVIERVVRESLPWAQHITVGRKTIRLYDYRCPHNPDGRVGKCDVCVGRRLEWATPLPAAEAIRFFDKGGNPIFPRFILREDEARVVPATQDKVKKRKAQAKYLREVAAGTRTVNHKSAKALARAKSNRRKG